MYIYGNGVSFLTQSTVDDVVVERETYQTTREGLEQMYAECQKRLRDEIKTRQVLNNILRSTDLKHSWSFQNIVGFIQSQVL